MYKVLKKVICLVTIFSFYDCINADKNRTKLDFIYHKYDVMTQFLENFETSYPELATLYSIGKSIKQRNLWVMKFEKKTKIRNKANIKLIGNIHGNEAVGREVLLHFIKYIGEEQKKNADIKHLLKYNVIHILPSMNPDAFEISKVECETNHGRLNVREVDLNRNFPDIFHKNPIPLQPEAGAMITWMNQTNFILSASLHGGALVANYPFDSIKEESSVFQEMPSKSPDDAIFRHLALTYSQNHPEMHKGFSCEKNKMFENGITNGAAWYAFSGGMQDYNYAFKGCMELTLEISCCKYPSTKNLEILWKENTNALVKYCLQSGLGVKGMVFDSITNNTISNADLQIEGINMTFHTDMNGTYFRLLLPGDYVLKVSAKNYITARKKFTVLNETTYPIMTVHDIYLLEGNDTQVNEILTEHTSMETKNDETTILYDYNTLNTQKFETTENIQAAKFGSYDKRNNINFLKNKTVKNSSKLIHLSLITSIAIMRTILMEYECGSKLIFYTK